MNLLRKIFKKTKIEYSNYKGTIDGEILMINPYIDIISSACAECYNTDNDSKDYDQRAEYISRRISSGHESILEHSNIVMLITITSKAYEDLIEFESLCKFLNIKTRQFNDNTYILIGGSLRGYKSIIRNIENPDNIVYKCMLNQLYHLNKNIFKDLIEDEIMSEILFKDDINMRQSKVLVKDNISITNIDDIDGVLNKISKYGFNKDDLFDMCTVTVYFSKLPRIISQQVTRHRNAITQASQRYINYSNAEFISPAECKPERYDKNKLYAINVFGEKDVYTLEEIGKEIISIYPQLVEQGLLKEDARAFLPNNTETSLFVTFTFRNLFHFLSLRMDKAAQADIRFAANNIYDVLSPKLNMSLEDMRKSLSPVYKKIQEVEDLYEAIDEVLE